MIILDTNVIIDIGRGRSSAEDILKKYKDEVITISAITIQELYVGLGYTLQKYGKELYEKNKEKTQKLLEGYKIFKINQAILERSGIIKGKLKAKGITIEIQDLIIGATAEISKMEKIITRNPKHFEVFKIPIESYKIE